MFREYIVLAIRLLTKDRHRYFTRYFNNKIIELLLKKNGLLKKSYKDCKSILYKTEVDQDNLNKKLLSFLNFFLSRSVFDVFYLNNIICMRV